MDMLDIDIICVYGDNNLNMNRVLLFYTSVEKCRLWRASFFILSTK